MIWNPIIPADLYFPLALLGTFIGIFAIFWLLFYVEHSRDLSRRDRILGTFIRLVTMSISLGSGVFFFTLVEIF